MTIKDPQLLMRDLVAKHKKFARTITPGGQIVIGAVYVDRPLFDAMCRAHGVDPRNAKNGVSYQGVKVAPLDVVVV